MLQCWPGKNLGITLDSSLFQVLTRYNWSLSLTDFNSSPSFKAISSVPAQLSLLCFRLCCLAHELSQLSPVSSSKAFPPHLVSIMQFSPIECFSPTEIGSYHFPQRKTTKSLTQQKSLLRSSSCVLSSLICCHSLFQQYTNQQY